MTLFSEKVLISNRYISRLMPNLIRKSWTDSRLKIIIIATRHRRHRLLPSWHLVELQANEGHPANFAWPLKGY